MTDRFVRVALSFAGRLGECRWCRCTDADPCQVGCSWANATHTLCSACVDLERAMQTRRGRIRLAVFLHAHDFEDKA